MPINDDTPFSRDRRPAPGGQDWRGPARDSRDDRWQQQPSGRDRDGSQGHQNYPPQSQQRPRDPGGYPQSDRPQPPRSGGYSGFSQQPAPQRREPAVPPPPQAPSGFHQDAYARDGRAGREPQFDPYPAPQGNYPTNQGPYPAQGYDRDYQTPPPSSLYADRDDLFSRTNTGPQFDQGSYQPQAPSPFQDYEQNFPPRGPEIDTSNQFYGQQGQAARPSAPDRGFGSERYDAAPPPPSSFDRLDAFDDGFQQHSGFSEGYREEHDEHTQATNLPMRTDHGDELDEDFFADDDDLDHDHYAPAKKGRTTFIALALAGALVIGGGGAYVFKIMKRGGSSDKPIITASTKPSKFAPSAPGGLSFKGDGKQIYERLTPDGTATTVGPTLASMDTRSSTGPATGGSTGSSLEERIDEALRKAGSGSTAATKPGPEAPTVVPGEVYAPDGRRLDAGAAASASSGRPVVTATLTPAGPGYSPWLGTQTSAAPAPAPQADDSAPQAVQAPTGRTRIVSAPPISQAPTAAASGSSSAAGGFFVQIKSSQDEAAATKELPSLTSKYSGALGDLQFSTRTVDLGGKGVWFRTVAGPLDSKDAAKDVCEKLKGAGLKDCKVWDTSKSN